MRTVNFALIREGTSDDGLVPHLRNLLVKAGVTEAFGSPRNYKGKISERLSAFEKSRR